MLTFAEALAPTCKICIISCGHSLLSYYGKRDYAVAVRYPVEKFILVQILSKQGLEMVYMRKNTYVVHFSIRE